MKITFLVFFLLLFFILGLITFQEFKDTEGNVLCLMAESKS